MNPDELVMVCPSRGRPGNIRELAKAWKQTGAQAHLLVVVDDDDPELDDYLWLDVDLQIIDEPRRLGPILNSVVPALVANTDYEAIGFLGDDHRPRTHGWDQALVDALPGVAYGNDLFQGSRLPTAVAMSAGIVRELGYFVPPGTMHLYFDDFWLTLGRELSALTYLPEVVIEHMHPQAGKATWDEGYRRANSVDQFNADAAAYQQFIFTQWPADRHRLRSSPWQH